MTGIRWLDITIAVSGVFGVLGVGGWGASLITKRVRPITTFPELITELQEERAEDRTRLAAVERSQRITIDYVHALRQHIVDGKPPPPPPWPPELNA